jgi:hypothetical protein
MPDPKEMYRLGSYIPSFGPEILLFLQTRIEPWLPSLDSIQVSNLKMESSLVRFLSDPKNLNIRIALNLRLEEIMTPFSALICDARIFSH